MLVEVEVEVEVLVVVMCVKAGDMKGVPARERGFMELLGLLCP